MKTTETADKPHNGEKVTADDPTVMTNQRTNRCSADYQKQKETVNG